MPLSQSNIKFISSLRQKKFRQSYHKFTVEGVKIISELLAQQNYRIDHLYATAEWVEQSGVHLSGEELTFPLTIITEKELKRISQLTSPNQVLAVVDIPEFDNEQSYQYGTGWRIYLDGIQSPANLGAILRVADWFGFDRVYGGPGTADLYSPKSIQASMGTFLRVNYREESLANLRSKFPEVPIYAADLAGENIFTFSPPRAGILVIGNEGKGIGSETRSLVNGFLRIPRAPDRKTESLNAAVAAGLFCGEIQHKIQNVD